MERHIRSCSIEIGRARVCCVCVWYVSFRCGDAIGGGGGAGEACCAAGYAYVRDLANLAADLPSIAMATTTRLSGANDDITT